MGREVARSGEGIGRPGGRRALADILLGLANPCGKLARASRCGWRIILHFTVFPAARGRWNTASIYVGYRYYDKAGKDVLFPLGTAELHPL